MSWYVLLQPAPSPFPNVALARSFTKNQPLQQQYMAVGLISAPIDSQDSSGTARLSFKPSLFYLFWVKKRYPRPILHRIAMLHHVTPCSGHPAAVIRGSSSSSWRLLSSVDPLRYFCPRNATKRRSTDGFTTLWHSSIPLLSWQCRCNKSWHLHISWYINILID